MYDAVADPHCYADTTVLKNIPGIRDRAAPNAFEVISATQRTDCFPNSEIGTMGPNKRSAPDNVVRL